MDSEPGTMRAANHDIYARKVPGISDGGLANAMNGESEVAVNNGLQPPEQDHFSNYQPPHQSTNFHHASPPTAPAPHVMPGNNQSEKAKRRNARDKAYLQMAAGVAKLAETVEEYHRKEKANQGLIYDEVTALQCTTNTRTWILIVFGSIILILLTIVLVILCRMQKGVTPKPTLLKSTKISTFSPSESESWP